MTQPDPSWPSGNGEMAGRIRTHDWSATPLGPIADWSERLKLTVEQVLGSPIVSTLTCEPERLFIYNDTAARHFGAHHPAALGRPLPDVFPEGWATVAPFYARAFAGETVQVGAQPLDTRGEGAAMDVFDALLAPVRESDGSVAYVHMTGAEVADRARIEAALRESEERLGLAIEIGGLASWDWDLRTGRVTWSDRHYLMQGYQVGEVTPSFEAWLARLHPEDRQEILWLIEEARDAHATFAHAFRVRWPDGTVRWCSARGRFFYAAEGEPIRMIGVMEDTTERKRVETELRESETRHRLLIEGWAQAVWETDAHGVVVADSPSWRA